MCWSWATFCVEVEKVFGLNADQMLERLYGMAVLPGESTAQFVVRIDQARQAIKAPSSSIFHAFLHKLDEHTRLLVDNMRMNKRAGGLGSVGWEDVFAICRDALAGVSVVTPLLNALSRTPRLLCLLPPCNPRQGVV